MSIKIAISSQTALQFEASEQRLFVCVGSRDFEFAHVPNDVTAGVITFRTNQRTVPSRHLFAEDRGHKISNGLVFPHLLYFLVCGADLPVVLSILNGPLRVVADPQTRRAGAKKDVCIDCIAPRRIVSTDLRERRAPVDRSGVSQQQCTFDEHSKHDLERITRVRDLEERALIFVDHLSSLHTENVDIVRAHVRDLTRDPVGFDDVIAIKMTDEVACPHRDRSIRSKSGSPVRIVVQAYDAGVVRAVPLDDFDGSVRRTVVDYDERKFGPGLSEYALDG